MMCTDTCDVATLKEWIESYESTRMTPINEHTAIITSEYNMVHLRLFLRFRQRQSAEQCGIARLGKFHHLFDEIFLVGRGRYVVQYLVLVRTVHAHILRCAVVRYLVVERRQFRHLDEVAEASLLHDVVRHVELEVRRLLGEYRRPCVEAADVLLLQRLRTQVLEQQVQFRQRVADGRA